MANIIDDAKALVTRVWRYVNALLRYQQLQRPPLLPSGLGYLSSDPEIRGRFRIAKLLDMYDGNQLVYADAAVQRKAPRNRDDIVKFLETQNVLRFAVESVQAFKNGVTIKTPQSEDQALVDSIVNSSHYDVFLQDVLIKTLLCSTLPVKVYWCIPKKSVAFDPIPPIALVVDTDPEDPSTVVRLAYPSEVTKNYTAIDGIPTLQVIRGGETYVWTKDTFQVYGSSSARIPKFNKDNPDNTNPYGLIPFAYFRDREKPSQCFFSFPDEALDNGQDSINYSLSELNWLKTYQSWSIPVLFGYEGDTMPEIGPGKPLALPLPVGGSQAAARPDLEFRTPTPNFEFLGKDIDNKISRYLFPFGVSAADFVASKERRSAEAIQYSSAKLDELRENLRLSFASAQQDLWNIVKVVHNTHAEEAGLKKFSEGAVFTIEYYSAQQIPPPWKERQEEYDWKVQRGLMTLPEVLVAESDDLDVAAAEQKILENMQKNASLGQPAQRPSGSVVPTGGT